MSDQFTIFLAEDQIYIRKIIQINLERKKIFKVQTAENGSSALNFIYGAEKIDLFLLDIMMPDMTGFDVLKEIRKIDKFKTTPVIMLTAISTKQKVIEAISLGANDYITKPFIMDNLIEKVCQKLDIDPTPYIKKEQ
jgi:DNA-binding response OmpR family regulator